jgi:hypothetical protein
MTAFGNPKSGPGVFGKYTILMGRYWLHYQWKQDSIITSWPACKALLVSMKLSPGFLCAWTLSFRGSSRLLRGDSRACGMAQERSFLPARPLENKQKQEETRQTTIFFFTPDQAFKTAKFNYITLLVNGYNYVSFIIENKSSLHWAGELSALWLEILWFDFSCWPFSYTFGWGLEFIIIYNYKSRNGLATKSKLGNTVYFTTMYRFRLHGSRNFLQFVIPPAIFAATFTNMGCRVGLCLQAERNQFQHLL